MSGVLWLLLLGDAQLILAWVILRLAWAQQQAAFGDRIDAAKNRLRSP